MSDSATPNDCRACADGSGGLCAYCREDGLWGEDGWVEVEPYIDHEGRLWTRPVDAQVGTDWSPTDYLVR